MPATPIRLLSATDKTFADTLKPGAYLRTLDPAGFLVRLPQDATPANVRGLARLLSHKEADYLSKDVTIESGRLKPALVAAFVGGLQLGTYRPGVWRTDAKPHPLAAADASVVTHDLDERGEDQLERERILADIQLRIIALVDAPANVKRPQYLADYARRSGKTFGYDVRVLDKKACEKEKLGALLAVNRGSEDEARFIIMEYRGGRKRDRPVAMIGKGITFDTGGVSIKGSSNLHLMKSDMGGAAAVLGTLEAAARLRLPVNLVGIVPATDNSVDALSYKPSDVITGHAGKTIEIIDTDAEGRLVMSDGLSYAVKHYDPAVLIDVATLTGSAVRTFGYECGAVMTKNKKLLKAFRKAGERSGELVWPLPTWDAYRAGLDSDVADIKNYSGRPINGAIDAFKFLEFFTHDHPAFVHFDIAGVALKQSPFAKDRQATGFGLRLFVAWLSSLKAE